LKWFSEEDIGIQACLRDGNQQGMKNSPRNNFYVKRRTLTYIYEAQMETGNPKHTKK